MRKSRLTYLDLDGSMRGVHLHIPGLNVGYTGVAVLAGSRDENLANHLDGMAHFVEHTIFKGTTRRSSWHIINRMEAVGGELNAFTTKQDTVVYSIFPGSNLSRATELIADLVINSRFPESELTKERQVVAEEISTYRDIPSEAVFDDFEDLIFRGTSLGHNILGTVKSLKTFDSDRCRAWIDTYYRPERMVVFYAGATGVDRWADTVKRYFKFTPSPSTSLTLSPPPVDNTIPNTPEQVTRHIRGCHQTNVVLGSQIENLDDSSRVTMALLTNILGGPGMNSRLNVLLRERHGLVYNIEAGTSYYRDRGLFTIYYGCDPEHNEQCDRLVRQAIDEIINDGLTPRALSMAKKQYLGQLTVASQNIENHIISLARATLSRGRALSNPELRSILSTLTSADLSDSASHLLPLSSLTFAP